MTRTSLAWIKDSSADLEAQRGRGDSTRCGGWAKSRVTGWLIKKGEICFSSKKTLENDKEVPTVWFIIIPILLKLWKVSLIEFELSLNISLDSNWRQIFYNPTLEQKLERFVQITTVTVRHERALLPGKPDDWLLMGTMTEPSWNVCITDRFSRVVYAPICSAQAGAERAQVFTRRRNAAAQLWLELDC